MNQRSPAGITLWAIPRFHRNDEASYASRSEQESTTAQALKPTSFQPTTAPQLVLSETGS